MALSHSLATIAAVAVLSNAAAAQAQQFQPSVENSVRQIEKIAEDAAQLRRESRWSQFRELVGAAEQVHQQASKGLAEKQKRLEEAQRELDAALAKIERPQIMIQAILAEVRDLDGEVLKAACQRVNAEAIQAIESGKPTHMPVIYSMSSEQAGRILALIEKRRPTQIVSRPSILALDGQVAEIMVGQKVKNPVAPNAGPKNEDIEWKDETVGLTVSLTPSVQDNKKTRLDLIVDDSYLAGDPFPIIVEKKNGQTVASPVVNRTKLQTAMETAEGRTILVAVRSRKPADNTEPTKTTLLLLLTPRIVDDQTAAAGEILHH